MKRDIDLEKLNFYTDYYNSDKSELEPIGEIIAMIVLLAVVIYLCINMSKVGYSTAIGVSALCLFVMFCLKRALKTSVHYLDEDYKYYSEILEVMNENTEMAISPNGKTYEIRQIWYCPDCGERLKEGTKKCKKCKCKLDEKVEKEVYFYGKIINNS